MDWESFFTLFYGAKAFVARTVTALQFGGFFATPNTDHAWFNYSLGCAAVTISPEPVKPPDLLDLSVNPDF